MYGVWLNYVSLWPRRVVMKRNVACYIYYAAYFITHWRYTFLYNITYVYYFCTLFSWFVASVVSFNLEVFGGLKLMQFDFHDFHLSQSTKNIFLWMKNVSYLLLLFTFSHSFARQLDCKLKCACDYNQRYDGWSNVNFKLRTRSNIGITGFYWDRVL